MGKVGWIIFGAVVVLILGGLVVYSRLTNPAANVADVDANSIIAASDASGNIADRVFGNADSKVVLIEYGDFQCPGCSGAHPQIKALTEEYEDRIAFVFRNFPLTGAHPNARAAAAAAEAAGQQDQYWAMHNLIFESQNEWSSITDGAQRTNIFAGYAERLNLDKEKFLTDLASTNINKKISFDQALGKRIGVNATPTFYLNGQKISEEASTSVVRGDSSKLKELIDKALE